MSTAPTTVMNSAPHPEKDMPYINQDDALDLKEKVAVLLDHLGIAGCLAAGEALEASQHKIGCISEMECCNPSYSLPSVAPFTQNHLSPAPHKTNHTFADDHLLALALPRGT